ncbi:MAG: hypothetical protein MH252_08855 [Thermosynechococcaceae cyanobacterium MS004]|nr:hypothetical protein [Thermosynechococcaceae cyanobacterium MS004]
MSNQQLKPSKRVQDIQERCLELAAVTRERDFAQVIQLPLWHEPKRGTPNSFIRSALFAAIQSKDRTFVKDKILASQEGITVKFTGEQLNQEDLTVWETLVHLARKNPLGHEFSFTGYGILKTLGLPKSTDHYKTLEASINRLTACLVRIENKKYVYGGGLIHSFVIDKDTKHFKIELNRELIKLFSEDDWTGIEWQQRLELRRKPLAQALHAYFSSHSKPHPIKLTTLKALTGSRNTQPAGFKRNCRNALDALVKIGFLQSYEMNCDLVMVQRIHRALPSNQ